ncbi:hypothetical protein ACGFT2_02695 [Streptomyces sp. NPDC048514]|uniref:hypothetical protein n=1 Tax=Streptomyces sp. NPDC048514 TaxID=3365564 RepID=UPI00371FAFB3
MNVSAHPLVVRARRLAAELLVPEAERVDREGVPASHIAAVRRAGLLGVAASGSPMSAAGPTPSPITRRRSIGPRSGWPCVRRPSRRCARPRRPWCGRGGRAMALTNRAQRLAREALFLLVRGQTPESRSTHLRSLSRDAGAGRSGLG